MYMAGFGEVIKVQSDTPCPPNRGGAVLLSQEQTFNNYGPGGGRVPTGWECTYMLPPAAAAAPASAPVITVTVPTQTTVSPQISPQLVQQQSPSNSPVNAGATQSQPANSGNTSSSGATSEDVAKMISDALAQRYDNSQAAPYVINVPAQNTPAPIAASDPGITVPTPFGPSTLPTTALPWVIGAGVIGLVLYANRKRK